MVAFLFLYFDADTMSWMSVGERKSREKALGGGGGLAGEGVKKRKRPGVPAVEYVLKAQGLPFVVTRARRIVVLSWRFGKGIWDVLKRKERAKARSRFDVLRAY
jgi:hypothetical protein